MEGKYILIFKPKFLTSLFKNSHELKRKKYFPRKADCSELPDVYTPIFLHKCQDLRFRNESSRHHLGKL